MSSEEGAVARSGELKMRGVETYRRPQVLHRFRQLTGYLGPAFVVSVAYIDPGNFATNITGGANFNYSLIWVILWSNLMAVFLQTISAKLGIATGASLPEMCAKLFSRRVNRCLWLIATIAAMATYFAEFLGAALGLFLLFKLPLIYACILTAIINSFILYLEKYGQRVTEAIIAGLVAIICIAYGIEVMLAKPDWTAVGYHALVPELPNGQAVLIAAGMLGATVMPHVIYLHSQLVQCRNKPADNTQKLKHFRMERIDIIIAMNIAFIINTAMVVVAASVFFTRGMAVDSITQAHQSLVPLLGPLSGGAFAVALLASGLSSSAVGTMAGQTIMNGFINLKVSRTAGRLVTMVPAFVIISLGINPMQALVMSQVILSFALPAAIIPLILISGRRDVMGALVNKPLTNAAGWLIAALIITLNAVLLYLTFTGNI